MAVQLEVIGIAVRDMAASLRFYRLLGLSIPDEADSEPHVEVATGGTCLAWDTVDLLKEVYGEWVEEPVGHRVELAFNCGSREEVDALYARVVAEGYGGHKAPWDAFWGQRYAIVADPDGNLISLFA
ncbi:MAG TPA: VOC family protein [Ardenticatenaceae bacterium]|jgi:catechol 2,3-dioxygenase-like lactoylglutathione lyase family enzyme